MKKFLLTVLFLVLLIAGGVGYFLARSFNADNFQKSIVKIVSEATGREFNVMGSTHVSWMPSPEIIFNDVSLSSSKGSTRGVMVTIPKIAIQLTWKSLLNKPIVIDKIKLENPVLYLERIDSQHVNWDFNFLSKKALEDTSLGFSSDLMNTRIDNLEIENGVVNYLNQLTNAKVELTNINGKVTMDTLQGPYSFNGFVERAENEYVTDLKLEQLIIDTPAPFNLSIKAKDKSLTLDLTGEMISQGAKGTSITADGSFSVERPNVILKELGLKPLSSALNIPATGGLSYVSQNGFDSIKNFTVRFGETDSSVAISGSLSREDKDGKLFYTAGIDINHFNTVDWKDLIEAVEKTNLTDANTPDYDLKLNAQKITKGTQTVNDFSLSLSKKADRIIIHTLKAVLDGETNVFATGGSLSQDEQNGWSLIVSGESKNLRTLLSKYINIQKMAPNVLQKAAFEGNILYIGDNINIDIERFETDGGYIKGKLDYLKAQTPFIGFTGSVENFDLDKYVGYKPAKEKSDLVTLLPMIKSYFQNASFLTGKNGKVTLDMKEVTAFNLPMRKVKLEGSLENGLLKLTQVRVTDAAMASVLSSAEIDKVATPDQKINSLRLDFSSKELKLFLDRANLVSYNPYLNNEDKLSVNLTVSEDNNNWTGNYSTKIGELETILDGDIYFENNVPFAKDLKVELTYPSFQKFLKDVVMTDKINNALEGDLIFKGLMNGSADDMKFKASDIQIGVNHIEAEGSLKNTSSQKIIDIVLKTPSFDFDKYMVKEFIHIFEEGRFGEKAFDFSLLDLWQVKLRLETGQILFNAKELKNAIVDLSIQDKMLSLNELSGVPSNEGSSLKVNGSISWSGVPQMKMDINLAGLELTPNLLTSSKTSFGGGVLTLSGKINSLGKSPVEMRKNLGGSGKLQIMHPMFVGADLQKITPLIQKTIQERRPKHEFDTEISRFLTTGKTTLESLSGNFTIDNGILKMMDTSLKAEGFYSNPMQIIYNMPKKEIDVSVPISLASYADLPPFALSLKGKTSAPVYLTNFVDLSNAVEDLVEKDNTKIAEALQKEKEKLAAISSNERAERIQVAIEEARAAVKTAEKKLYAGDNESASYLLQNAKDALSVVNQLSVKESLTDAQYIQLMEQSRLAVLKANESVDEAVRDLYFEDRKQVQAFVKQALEMQERIEIVYENNPHIEIVAKLLPASRQYVEALQQINQSFGPDISVDDHATLMQAAKEAFLRVARAYEYVSRFETDDMPTIKPLSVRKIPNEDILEGANEGETEEYPSEEEEEYSNFRGVIER